jgi:hypothetical protein
MLRHFNDFEKRIDANDIKKVYIALHIKYRYIHNL